MCPLIFLLRPNFDDGSRREPLRNEVYPNSDVHLCVRMSHLYLFLGKVVVAFQG